MTRSTPTLAPLATRLTALATAALVVMLTVFAASPTLHAWLHSHQHVCPGALANGEPDRQAPADTEDHLCVVTQFAGGSAEAAVGPDRLQVAVPRVTAAICGGATPAFRAVDYLLPPGRGPPLV